MRVAAPFVGLAAAGLGAATLVLAAGPTAPKLTVEVIQRAYETAAQTSGAAHVAGLTVRQADCLDGSEGASLCWVKYTDSGDAHAKEKSDVVSLERRGGDWRLTAGLCLPPR